MKKGRWGVGITCERKAKRPFRTQAAARAAGLRTADEWLAGEWQNDVCRRLVPRRDARPIVINRVKFFREADCEELVSKSAASERGLSVPKSAKPVTRLYWEKRGLYYDVFRASDCVGKRKVTKRPAVNILVTVENVLAACWTVNRSAKRYRDAASKCYNYGSHGFARRSRVRKEELYIAKDRAIRWLVAQRALAPESIHGGLCLWTGGGYSFHSTLVPTDAELPTAGVDVWRSEAKPREKAEMRLTDAVGLIDRLPDVDVKLHRLPPPAMREKPSRRHRWRDDWDEEEERFDGWEERN